MSETAPTVPPLRHILDISLEVTPAELVESGDVTLSFVIRNDSGYDAAELYLVSTNGRHSESLGDLPAGETRTYTRTYTVSDDELGEGKLSFTISHEDIVPDGVPVEYTLDVLINRIDAAPGLEFTRQLSARSVTAGSGVLLTYRVHNAGNVPVTDIALSDTLGGFTGRIDILAPGASKVFSSRITVNEDVVSKPAVSYNAGGETHIIELDGAPITVVEPVITTALTIDRQSAAPGDTVNGVITIAAAGSDFTDITVTDDVNHQIIADTLELSEGETLTVTCTWPVRENTDFRIRVDAVSKTGEKLTVSSNTAVIALDELEPYTELAVSANAQSPRLNAKGGARILIAITNTGTVPARNVTLSEAGMGVLRTFDFIPEGEPTVKTVLVDVQRDSEFVFTVEYTGDDGETVSAVSAPVAISITPDGDDPVTADERNGIVSDLYELRDSSAFYWMLGGGVAVLLVLVILLIVSHDRERRERKLRMEMGKQRRREPAARTQRTDKPHKG